MNKFPKVTQPISSSITKRKGILHIPVNLGNALMYSGQILIISVSQDWVGAGEKEPGVRQKPDDSVM